MPGVNKVTLLGFVGDTPEFRSTADGKYTCYLLLETSARVKDATGGASVSVAQQHRVVFSGDLALLAHMRLKRGGQVCVEGSLTTRKWIDTATNDVFYSSEVVGESLEIIGMQHKSLSGTHVRHTIYGQSNGAASFSSAISTSGTIAQTGTDDDVAIEAVLKTGAMAWKDGGSAGRWVADLRV